MPEPDTARGYTMGAGAGASVKLDTEQAQAAIANMTASLKGLEKALKDFGNNAWNIADKINRHLKTIGDTATKVADQLGGMTAAVTGATGATTGPTATPTTAATASSGSGAAAGWVSSAASSISKVVNTPSLPGGLSLGTFLGTGGTGEDWKKDLVMAPLRFLRSRINTNRDTAIMASGALNMAGMQQGTGTGDMMSTLARFPGSVMGSPQDLLGMFASAPALGASYGFGGGKGQGVRARGFFEGIRQMQVMNPMAQVGELTSTLGGYAGNTAAQQRSMMFTGGAMSMIAAGGRQKSLSEWAESILRWFEGLRPGAKRNKGFDYGELMSQYFPGSNIDAWFNMNQVPQNMRDYWWTYALGKAKKTPDTRAAGFEVQPEGANVAWNRLRASTELTRTEFSLAGKMSGQYANREQSNRWFNQLMGQIQETVIPAISKSVFSWIQFLPDSVEDLMMTGAERGLSELMGKGDVPNAAEGIGDNGYGSFGGSDLSGLHPDMRAKIGKMMKANPRLTMTSGLRDTGLQERLKGKGYNNVSGKPSAHTRGMAADLGPKSQYGWIAANAKRFGLATGRNHGEPWHVGMPGDIGDLRQEGLGDFFSDFIDSVKGFASTPEGMAGFITKILSKLTGALGTLMGGGPSGTADTAAGSFGAMGGAYQGDALFDRLAEETKKVQLGMPSGSTTTPSTTTGGASGKTASGADTVGTTSGWSANNKTWRGTSTTGRGSTYNQTASADIMADIVSNDAMHRGRAVAKALHNAGFTGDVLRNFMRISYRESNWIPNKWVEDSDDTGGGILGLNQLPWTKSHSVPPFTQADVIDPQASAFIAMDMYKNVSPVNGPGGPNTYHPWNVNGNWQGNIPVEAAALTDQAIASAGVGDVPGHDLHFTPGRGSTGVVFNNEFHLSVPTLGGGSNGGIDIRRTVSLLADHLEVEMKRRLARAS